LKVDIQADPWFFLTVHSHELHIVNILQFYPAHFDRLIANALIPSKKRF
jgi:hypothetical protein